MPIPIVEPVTQAIRKTREILFDTFEMSKWLELGFCAFLTHLGSGAGSSFNFNGNIGGRRGSGGGFGVPVEARNWVQDNLGLVIAGAIGVFVFVIVMVLLVSWLSSRGQFMFIDGVVHNRGAVRAPWHEFKNEAHSLFLFKLCLVAASYGVFILLGGVCLMLAWSDIHDETFGGGAIAAIALFGLLGLPLALVGVTVNFLLHDFVAPAMYLRRIRVMAAWRVVREEIIGPHKGTLVLYFLFQMVLGICIALVAFIATCCTCCITAVPYIGTVLLLPIFVFMLSYKLYFLEGFGESWLFFPQYIDTDAGAISDGELGSPAHVDA